MFGGDIVNTIIGGAIDWWQGEKRQSDIYDQSFQTQERQQAYNISNAKTAWERSQQAVKEQWAREVEAYKNRYAWTAKSLKDAGLNPILAIGKGYAGVSAPHSAAAQSFMPTSSAVPMGTVQPSQFSTSAKNMATAKKTYKESSRVDREIELLDKQARESLANAIRARSQANLFSKQEQRIISEISKIKSEMNLNKEKEKLTKADRLRMIELTRKITAEVVRLNKVAKIYDTPVGTIMLWVKELLGSVGIPLTGIIGYGAGKYLKGSKIPKIDIYPKKFHTIND